MTLHDKMGIALQNVTVDQHSWPVDVVNFDRYLMQFRDASKTQGKSCDPNCENNSTPSQSQYDELNTCVVQQLLFAVDKMAPPTPVEDRAVDRTTLIREAFFDVNAGASTDLVVADPDRNCEFVQACWKRGIQASQSELNHWLLGARKAKKIGKIPGVVPHRVPRQIMEAYEFGSEIGARLLQDIVFSEEARWVSLDDILCDPKLGRRFVSLAELISPGFKPVDYRWAALSIRKAMNRKIAKQVIDDPSFTSLGTAKSVSVVSVPNQPGFFWIKSGETSFYIGHTSDLREKVTAMMKADFATEVNRVSSCLLFDGEPLEYLIAPAPAMPISHRFEVKNRVVARQCPRLNITKEMDRRVA